MSPTELAALEALAGRTLTPGEQAQIAPLVAEGGTQAIADILSVGRTTLISLTLTERGVRENLSITAGAAFLKALRELNEATVAPAWLTTLLTAMQVPEPDRWAYFDTLQCGWTWLRGNGLDVGTGKVRSMLDLLAAAVNTDGPNLVAACATLKALAVQPAPVTHTQVGAALAGVV